MGPAVRRTRPQSRITAAPVQDPNHSVPKVGIAGAVRPTSRSKPAVGNGIFGCRDRAPKIITKKGERLQRPKSGKRWPEIPAEAPYLGSTGERVVCGDWMVGAPGLEPGTR